MSKELFGHLSIENLIAERSAEPINQFAENLFNNYIKQNNSPIDCNGYSSTIEPYIETRSKRVLHGPVLLQSEGSIQNRIEYVARSLYLFPRSDYYLEVPEQKIDRKKTSLYVITTRMTTDMEQPLREFLEECESLLEQGNTKHVLELPYGYRVTSRADTLHQETAKSATITEERMQRLARSVQELKTSAYRIPSRNGLHRFAIVSEIPRSSDLLP